MKKFAWKGIAILAMVMSVTALVMMFAGLGTTTSRLVLTVIATASIIATVMLMPKQEATVATTGAPATPAVTPAPVATPATTPTPAPVATPTTTPTPAPDTPATVSHDDVVNTISLLTRYYSERPVTIADETAYLQATEGLADTLMKTSALYVQAQQKRRTAEQRAVQLNNLLNGNNQSP